MTTAPLNPKIFDDDVERVSPRRGYGEGLRQAGEEDQRIVALCGDLTESTMTHLFRDKFPERFIEMGIAEQSMASVASGLAAMGKIPFIASYAIFSPGRNWEQIRTTICFNHTNVKIVGSHAGINVGQDGGTHQALEDIALMRVLPRMIVVSPCDAIEAKKATRALAQHNGPAYLRLPRESSPVMTTEDTPFAIGKAEIFFAPENGGKARVGIIATGPVIHNALIAARELAAESIPAKVLNLSTIKPIDEDAILSLAEEVEAIVTVEDHQVRGGMGSEVAEFLARTHPMRQEFVGIDDQFGQSGTSSELIEHYGLGVHAIINTVKKLF